MLQCGKLSHDGGTHLAGKWSVYIARCNDGTFYCGIAMDVERRMREHNSCDKLAARYTKARRPVTLVYSESAPSRSAAVKREGQIKRMTRAQKEKLINTISANMKI